MAETENSYVVQVAWTGNQGSGTSSMRDFTRDGEASAENHPVIPLSADPKFMGDPTRYNPEELLFAALANCHMLSFLFLCTRAGIVVTGYEDEAVGFRKAEPGQLGALTGATLQPKVTLADESRRAEADALHAQAHKMCLVAQSLKIPVAIEPRMP